LFSGDGRVPCKKYPGQGKVVAVFDKSTGFPKHLDGITTIIADSFSHKMSEASDID